MAREAGEATDGVGGGREAGHRCDASAGGRFTHRPPGRPGRSRRRWPGDDRGTVTAEAAVVLPLLALFAMGLVWALLAAAAQVQCVDAARAGARSAARQDTGGETLDTVRGEAPEGAEVTVSREGDLVRVRVSAEAPGPRGLGVRLSSTAVALAEETVGTGTGGAPEPGPAPAGTGGGSPPAGRAGASAVAGRPVAVTGTVPASASHEEVVGP